MPPTNWKASRGSAATSSSTTVGLGLSSASFQPDPDHRGSETAASALQDRRVAAGLVVVTAPRGAGKAPLSQPSSNQINKTGRPCSFTIEDSHRVRPFQYQVSHHSEGGGAHARSFADALRVAHAGEDPDLHLVGWLRCEILDHSPWPHLRSLGSGFGPLHTTVRLRPSTAC